MAHVIRLTDGTNTIDLTESWNLTPTTWKYGVLRGGTEWGHASDDPRIIKMRLKVTGSTLTALWQNVQAVSRLLASAGVLRTMAGQRSVYLEVQLNTMSTPVRHYVRRASITGMPDPFAYEAWQRRMLLGVELTLEVEPYGVGSEITLVSSALSALPAPLGVTHMYLQYGGGVTFSQNVASNIDGSLWQSNRLTQSPTIQTPAAGDILYFGNSRASTTTQFERLILGLQTALVAVGLTAAWEYWSGSVWTGFTPSSDFASSSGASNEWTVAKSLGQIVFGTLAGWAKTTINGVNAYWVRWRIGTLTSMSSVPVRENGPVRSLFGYAAIPAGVLGGDAPARARIELRNDPSGASRNLSGVRAAIHAGLKASVPPPVTIPAMSAQVYVPAGPETTVTAVSNAHAANGEHAQINVNQSLTDRAFYFPQDGEQGTTANGTDVHTAALSGSDKLSNLANGNFLVEAVLSVEQTNSQPYPVCAQWDTSGSRLFWLGFDQQQPRAIVYNGTNRALNSGLTATPGQPMLLALEYDRSGNHIRLYVNGQQQAGYDMKGSFGPAGLTTRLGIAKSLAFSTNDSRNGQSEVFGPFKLHMLRIKNQNVSQAYPAGYSNSLNNGLPTAPWSSDANTVWLLPCNDFAATNVVADSSSSPINGGMFNAGGSWNTNNGGFSVAGYYNTGGGPSGLFRILGWRLPSCFGSEFAGPYHVYLMANLGFYLTNQSDLKFALQLGVDQPLLPMTTPTPQMLPWGGPVNSWQLVDLGIANIPPIRVPDGTAASAIRAGALDCHLYVSHNFSGAQSFNINGLLFMPAFWWEAQYDTFRPGADNNSFFDMQPFDYLVYDDEGDGLVRMQTTNANNVPKRNPWARAVDDRPRLWPNVPLWLVASGGVANNDTVDMIEYFSDAYLSVTVKAVPVYEWLAS